MKTCVLDVDGVLVDCASVVHSEAERILGRLLPQPRTWGAWEFHDAMGLSPDEREFLDAALRADDCLGWKMDLYPGAERFVNALGARADIVFVTAGWKKMPHWVTARTNLLNHYFPSVDAMFVEAHAKWRVSCDRILDDKSETVQAAGNKGVLYHQPWNASAKGVRRVSNYAQALEALLG